MDNFKEEVIVRNGGKARNTLLYIITYISLAFFGILGLSGLVRLMGLEFEVVPIISTILGFGSCWFLWRGKDNLDTEYEYTYTSGEMDFAKVMAGKRRKQLMTLRLKDSEAGGVAEGAQFERYNTMSEIKKHDFTLNTGVKVYYIFFIREGAKHLLTMECSDEMWDMIVKTNPKLTK